MRHSPHMDIDGPYLESARQALAGMDEAQTWSDTCSGEWQDFAGIN